MNRADAPLLDESDFIRVIRSAAWVVVSRLQGLPPALASLEIFTDQTLAEFDFAESWPVIHQTMVAFLGLTDLPLPDLTKTVADYARHLSDNWLDGCHQIIFHTSGSTGEPKPFSHSEILIKQEALETGKLFFGLKRVLVTVPLLHSYGFIFGLMLPKTKSILVLDEPPLPTILAEVLKPGDLVVGFPLLFAKLETIKVPEVQFLSATDFCSDSAFQAIMDKGVARLTEIYGTSETGAVAVRYSPGPFQLLDHWRQADDRHLARQLPGSFEQKYALSDHLLWSDSRSFTIAGRLDDAVQVVGVNVYPNWVASVIKLHPQVKECAVRLMKPSEGFRLKAFIVPYGDFSEAELRQDLTLFLRSRLNPAERPGHLTFGSQLPLTIAGKLTDWNI
ncbi:MAG: AMP-binding protein [Deltaproteobacteria bacterium]|jgi:4-coumarate--CoA ligase (photoactive yellow protein activation family)|nr:AMP-binding protein [Deltaproteobacteria bacterium]